MKPLNKLRDIEYKAYTLKYYKKSSVYIYNILLYKY